MKPIEIVRGIDILGRYVIPVEVRKSYNINKGNPYEMFLGDEGEIILKPYFDKVEIFKETIINKIEKTRNFDKEKVIKMINAEYKKIIINSDF